MSKLPTILALDVAFANTGFVVFERCAGKWVPSEHGIIKTAKETKKRNMYTADDTDRRIRVICSKLDSLYEKWQPNLAVAELPTGGGKSSSSVKAMAIGASVVTSFTFFRGIPLHNVRPDDVKLATTGTRSASKLHIENVIETLYPAVADKYRSTKSRSGWSGEFEHVADAIGAFLAAESSPMVRMLETL